MSEEVAAAVWIGLAAYLACGVLVAAWLFGGGLARLDRSAAVAPMRVKLLIAPGLVALWPIVLRRFFVSAPEDAA